MLQTEHFLPDEYELVEVLSASSKSMVRRVRAYDSESTLILKTLSPLRSLSPFYSSRYRQEFELGMELGGRFLPRVLELFPVQRCWSILMEDIGARSLDKILTSAPQEPLQVVRLGLQLVDALEFLHEHHVVHRDLNPSNIVWNKVTGALQLIDLGIAARTPLSQKMNFSLRGIEGTLAYLAPEQSGRLQRVTDHRADFYALGVSLFQLLCGTLPFQSEDALELVYQHLSTPPPSPLEFQPDCPPALEQILLRLLQKTPEERYQSHQGLRHDLLQVEQSLLEDTPLTSFESAVVDVPMQLSFSGGLYGRLTELRLLEQALEKAVEGSFVAVEIAGYSGVGKTSLVREIFSDITRRRGWFLNGKFEQGQVRLPLAGLKQLFADLLELLLEESEEDIACWKSAVQERLGEKLSMLSAFSPELVELFGGEKPHSHNLFGASRHLLADAAKSLLRLVSERRGPLVLFLDDLQWSDVSSLKMLEQWFVEEPLEGVLLVLAYRNNEIEQGDPTHFLMKQLQAQQERHVFLQLRSLSKDSIGQWLEELVPLSTDHQQQLLNAVLLRTEGNPFFVRELLLRLTREGILYQGQQLWELDAERLEQIPSSKNVVDFLLDEWNSFSKETRLCLRVGALFGTVFPLSFVAQTLGWTQQKVAEVLEVARQRGALLSLDSSRSLAMLQQLEDETELQLQYMFVHDRIRESALQQYTVEERQVHSRKAGDVLLERETEGNLSHTLQGVDLLNESNTGDLPPCSPEKLLKANLLGAEKAFELLAFDDVVRYAELGLAVEKTSDSLRRERLSLALLGARGASLSGDFRKSDDWYEAIRPLLASLDDRLRLYRIQMDHYLLEGRLSECLDVSLLCLQSLGFDVQDSEPYANERLEALNERLLSQLKSEGVEVLRQAPWQEDDLRLAASTHGFYALFLSAYLQGKGALGFQALALLAQNTIERGKTLLTGYGLVGYGMVLTVLDKGFQLGFEIARCGAELAEEYDSPEMKAKTSFLFAADVHNWTQPVRQSLPYYERAWELSLQTGDWLTAGYVVIQSGSDRLTAGVPLSSLYEELTANIHFLEKRNNQDAILLLRAGVYQPLRLLLGFSEEVSFDDEDFCEADYEKRFADNSFYLAWLYAGRIRVEFLLGAPKDFPLWIERLEVVRTYIPTHAKVPECTFFCILMLLQRAESVKHPSEWLKMLELVADLERWFEAAPDNLRPRWEIVQARLAELRGEVGAAVDWYEKAILSADKAEYPNLRALALELYGNFWWKRGRRRFGLSLLQESRDAYLVWGAIAKVQQLEQGRLLDFRPFWRDTAELFWKDTEATGTLASTEPSSTTNLGFRLDMETLIRAATILAEARDESSFLQQLLTLSMQFAGALQAAVVFERRLYVGEIDPAVSGEPRFWELSDFEEADDFVPVRLFRRILRTGVSELIEGVGQCVPLIAQGETQGLLFLLENPELGGLDESGVQLLEHLSSYISTLLSSLLLYRKVLETNEHLRLQQRLQSVLVELARLFVNTRFRDLSETFRESLQRLAIALETSAVHLVLDASLFPEMEVSEWLEGEEGSVLPHVSLLKDTQPSEQEHDGRLILRDEDCDHPVSQKIWGSSPSLEAFSILCLRSQNRFHGAVSLEWGRPLKEDERLLYHSFLSVLRDLMGSLLERIYTGLLVSKSEEARHTTVVATVAGVAHEMNTPLGVALTADSVFHDELTALLEENPALPTRRLERASELLRKNLRRAAELVKDFRQVILDQSHGETRTLLLFQNIQQLLSTLEPMTRKLKLTVLLSEEGEAPPLTFVPGFLAQVLTNLLQNSGIHAYESQGGKVWIHLSTTEEWHTIEFWDEGIGMTDEIREQCLKPFFTTKRDTSGTGLGLFVVQKLVEIDMKGQLSLESSPEKGTEVTQ
jgi:predicted ATPase/signal transduction histidine kinase